MTFSQEELISDIDVTNPEGPSKASSRADHIFLRSAMKPPNEHHGAIADADVGKQDFTTPATIVAASKGETDDRSAKTDSLAIPLDNADAESYKQAGRQRSERTSKRSVISFRAEARTPGTSSRQIVKKEHLIGGKYTQHELAFVTTVGIFLSFNSGYVNGSCLSGLLTPSGMRQSVAAFTGAYTGSALLLADGQFAVFGRQLGMIFSFILGACISGYMTPNATPYRLEPTYGPTFVIGGVFLIIASILAVFERDDYLFYFAAAANG
jgi:hypothetical protein